MNKIILLLLLFYLSCTSVPNNKVIESSRLPSTLLEIPFTYNQKNHIIYKPLDSEDNINGFYFMERTDSVLYKFDINKKRVVNTYSLSSLFGRIDDFAIWHDTIAAIKYPRGQIVIQKLNNPSTARQYTLQSKEEYLGCSIEKKGAYLFVQSFPNFTINNLSNARAYYTKPVDNILALQNDSLVILKKFAHFPAMYQTCRYMDCFNGQRCLIDSQIIYSFNHYESVSVYNMADNNFYEKTYTSNYFKSPPDFDFNRLANLNYVNEYWNQITDFIQIQYNPWKKEFYRVMNHKSAEVSKLPFCKPWSLLIGDNNLNLRYEIIFPELRYRNNFIIPTRFGFAIPCIAANKRDTSNVKLYEFKIN